MSAAACSRFNLADLAVGLVAGLTIGLAFIIIALQVFLALIEFKIVTLGGFLLLPFAILDRTTSLAERALGFVLSAGLKIFALAIVVSFAFAIIPDAGTFRRAHARRGVYRHRHCADVFFSLDQGARIWRLRS